MAKTLKQLRTTTATPKPYDPDSKSAKEKKFFAAHKTEVHPDRSGNGDDVFKPQGKDAKTDKLKGAEAAYESIEDTEQLDELSKETLKSYIFKVNRRDLEGKGTVKHAKGMDLAAKKHFRKTNPVLNGFRKEDLEDGIEIVEFDPSSPEAILYERVGMGDHISHAIEATGSHGTSHDRVSAALRRVRENAPSHIRHDHPAMKHIRAAHDEFGKVKGFPNGSEHYHKVGDHLANAHHALMTHKEEIEEIYIDEVSKDLLWRYKKAASGRNSGIKDGWHKGKTLGQIRKKEDNRASGNQLANKKLGVDQSKRTAKVPASEDIENQEENMTDQITENVEHAASHAGMAEVHRSRKNDDGYHHHMGQFHRIMARNTTGNAQSVHNKAYKLHSGKVKNKTAFYEEDQTLNVSQPSQLQSFREKYGKKVVEESVEDTSAKLNESYPLGADLEPYGRAQVHRQRYHMAKDAGWVDRMEDEKKGFHAEMANHHQRHADFHRNAQNAPEGAEKP